MRPVRPRFRQPATPSRMPSPIASHPLPKVTTNMSAWILVLVLAGVPLGARGTFPNRPACMAAAYAALAEVNASKWAEKVEFQCRERKARAGFAWRS